MTVINNDARDQYVAVGGQTIFSYTFEISDQDNIQVYQRAAGSDPDDVADLLTLTVDYTVTGVGVNTGGTIVLTSGATLNDIITLQGNAPPVRSTTFTPGGVIQAANLNTEFDDEILIYQTILGVQDFLIPKYPKSAVVNDFDLVLPILGANQLWAMNGAGDEIVAVDITAIISGGTVTQINTGLGLTGGPITGAGTISFATMPANTFWANITGGVALPTQVSTDYFLQASKNLSDLTDDAAARVNLGLEIGVDVQAYSAALASIAGLTTVSNNLIYTTASNTYAALAPVANRVLASGLGGAISWDDTLPQAVQTNIQYLGTQNQNLNMGGFQINNGAEPIQPSDFATKNYVDLNALTGTQVYAASAGSLGTVTQSGSGVGATLTNAGVQAALDLDGVNPPAGQPVLIRNTATGMAAANEGIYTVTNAGSGVSNWVLTRSTTYDTPTEINQTGLIIVQNGSTLAGTAWYNAANIVTVDTTAFNYSQFGNITFPVSLAHGGTNANLTASAGAIPYSTSTALALTAVGSAGQIFQSAGVGTPVWTPFKLPLTAGAAGNILISDGTDYLSSTSLWPNTVGTVGKMLRSTGTVNAYTTATFADTYAASVLLYSNGANAITGLATANNGLLVTGNTGIPSILAGPGTTGNMLISNAAAPPSFTAFTYPTAVGAAGSVHISNGTNIVSSTSLWPNTVGGAGKLIRSDGTINAYTTSTYPDTNAINTLLYASSANTMAALPTANVSILVTGVTGIPSWSTALPAFSTSFISFNPTTSGIAGTPTNDNASAGIVGEFINSTIATASAVALVSGTPKTITSITLTAGDWDVWGSVFSKPAASTTSNSIGASISLATNTFGALSESEPASLIVGFASAAGQVNYMNTGIGRQSVSGSTTVYLVGYSTFAVSTMAMFGFISARRVR